MIRLSVLFPGRKIMMRMNFRVLLTLTIGVFAVSGIAAQGTSIRTSAADKYLISAKAGGVNYTEGAVTIIHASGRSGTLLKGDQLEIGDRVSTGESGRAEILLNPGSYLRVGANSAFEFKTTSLDDLQIKLDSGSAMFEVFATTKFRVNISTPKEKLTIFETGIYRVDLKPDGSGTLAVTEGKAVVGPIANLTLVTSGKMASFGSGPITVAKFNSGKRDELAEWSKTRGKELVKLTASLQQNTLRNSLFNSFNGGGWNFYNSFGLWIRDPFSGLFCFMPFGSGWYSPYGRGYGGGITNIIPVYIPPVNPTIDRTDLSRRRPVSQDDAPQVAFRAIERQQRESQLRRDPGGDRINGDGRYSSPANERNPGMEGGRSGGPTTMSPAPSSPAPARVDSPARKISPIDN